MADALYEAGIKLLRVIDKLDSLSLTSSGATADQVVEISRELKIISVSIAEYHDKAY